MATGTEKRFKKMVVEAESLVLGTGSGTAVDLSGLAATATEINRAADVSTRLVAAGATLTMTEAAHDGKIICLDTAAGSIVTLPTSSGGGAVYKFLITVTATTNSHIIKVGNATDEMRGLIDAGASEATAPNLWVAADNDDTITFNRGTTGTAAQGHWVEIVDATSGHFFVRGTIVQSGAEATPFSATVA
jgi:Flp pilus assembly protein TadG